MLKFSLKFVLFLLGLLAIVLIGLAYFGAQPKTGGKIFNQDDVSAFDVNNINFYQGKDGFWQIKNFDGYYASPKFIRAMLYVFKNSRYGMDAKKDEGEYYYTIKIGEKKYFTTGRLVKMDKPREMSVGIKLFRDANKYILKPIDYIDYKSVEKYSVDGLPYSFVDKNFINDINNMQITDVKKGLNLKTQTTVEVVLRSGMVVNIKYYADNWIGVEYKALSLSKLGIAEAVKKKESLTKGWYFRLIST